MTGHYDSDTDALRRSLLVFQMLGDEAGVEACLRALAALVVEPANELTLELTALTWRERQVVALIATGATNRAIARALGIREGTARRHVANLLNKLSFHSRSQVAGWLVELRQR